MFKNKAVALGVLYSVIIIIYKLIIILGGYALTRFGFFFSNIIGILCIMPVIFYAVLLAKKENGGYIAGREAVKIGLTTTVVAAVILSAYHIIEFEYKWRELSVVYYHSEAFKEFLSKKPQFKPEEYSKIIDLAISELSVFKSLTAKLFVHFFISLSGCFVSAVFLRKKKPVEMA